MLPLAIKFMFIIIGEILICLICWTKLFFLKIRYKSRMLYWHEKKSFLDTYSMTGKYLFLNIITFFLGLLVRHGFGDVLYNVIIGDFCVVIGAFIVNVVAIYMITEIKHISPNDGIGKQILQCADPKMKKRAWRFYKQEFFVGCLLAVLLLLEIIMMDKITTAIYLVGTVVVYIFGMADVLQHEGYNSDTYNEEYRKKNILDKLYIINIIRFFRESKYRQSALVVLKENTLNIYIGIRQIFNLLHH